MTENVWTGYFQERQPRRAYYVKVKRTNSGVMFPYMKANMKIVLHVLQEL